MAAVYLVASRLTFHGHKVRVLAPTTVRFDLEVLTPDGKDAMFRIQVQAIDKKDRHKG